MIRAHDSSISKGLSWPLVLILGLCVFLPLFWLTPDIWEDTAMFLHFDPTRPMLYPIFLWLFHVFGEYQFVVVMWAQAILNFLAILYAGNWLYKHLKIPKALIFITLLITVLYLLNYREIVRNILSEGIAFPLFIITVIALVDNFRFYTLKKFIYLMLVSNLLILARDQFYYLYSIFLLIIAWHLWHKVPIKKIFFSSIVFIVALIISVLIPSTYQKIVNDRFSNSAHYGMLLITQPLYLSNINDITLFKTSIEKDAFRKIMLQLEKEHLTKESAYGAPLGIESSCNYYSMHVTRIETIAQKSLPQLPSRFEANAILIKMSKGLFIHSFKENLAFNLVKTMIAIGNLPITIGILIIFFAIGTRLLNDRAWQPNINQIFISVALILIFVNAAFVSIVSHYDMRYFYYSYFLYFVLSALAAKEFLSYQDK